MGPDWNGGCSGRDHRYQHPPPGRHQCRRKPAPSSRSHPTSRRRQAGPVRVGRTPDHGFADSTDRSPHAERAVTETVPSRRQTIADDIRTQIAAGQLKAGERLPSEAILASRYGVSTSTLRGALALLQSEGLVEKAHGKGNFIGRASHRRTYAGGTRMPFEASQVGPGLRVTVRTTRLPAQGQLVPLLRVPPNTQLSQFLCIHNDGSSPHSLARIYVPCDLPPKDLPCEAPSCQAFGTRPAEPYSPLTEIRERLTARLPTYEEAEVLRISSTLAVLDITRVAIDNTGRVVEAALLVLPSHRADAYFVTRAVPAENRREG
ncbi:GntR family transcriptional regulator [Streptomyces sp. NPDC052225]|uniref:GntR family transcriptional regulator n=1 Tax=Streptomyces sp. NPDC052225 TaxID=3154949 RepID=UPI0034207518